jgi:hypothetical protein
MTDPFTRSRRATSGAGTFAAGHRLQPIVPARISPVAAFFDPRPRRTAMIFGKTPHSVLSGPVRG